MERQFSAACLQRTALTYLECSCSTKKTAKAMGVSSRTIRHRLQHIRTYAAHLLTTNTAYTKPPAVEEPSEAVEPDRFSLEIRRRDNSIADLKAKVKALENIVLDVENERDAYRMLRNTNVPLAPWPMKGPRVARAPSTIVPVLFSSDFQFGEVIKASELDGMNAFNKDIFAERYQSLITKSIDLVKNHTGHTEAPGVFYLRGGDALSGSIHDELAETNDLSAIPACRELLAHERAGIRRLKEAFGHVRVISIPGNHGRTTHKSRAKRYADLSFESLLGWWLASSFEDDPNVTFLQPDSGDAYFDVLGWKFLLSHGDRIGSRGGAGFVGPAATVARGHQKLMQNWMLSGRPVDVVLTGHMHTSLRLQHGFANGSLAGYNEYAQVIRAAPDSAKQWLLCVSEEYGAAQNFEVILSERPTRTIH